jgi:catechol 2,3-dioxygenase
MARITGLSHIVLHTNDHDKMVAFYQDVLGLVKYRENERGMVFLTSDPEKDDHEIALTRGRVGDAKIIGHIAWRVSTPAEVKEYYERFKATGVRIDHTISHAYQVMGNTVSCYFNDPDGNLLEVYAMVPDADPGDRDNRPLNLDDDLDTVIAQAKGLVAASRH